MTTLDGWRRFPDDPELEARKVATGFELRRAAAPDVVVTLTPEQWRELRAGGDLPEELQ